MSIIDKKLARTAYSGINYDNILRDVITIIQNDPDFSINFEDFTSSDAGRLIMELYAYIGDQLATRLDWYINEGYLPTATQRSSVIKLLKLINYKLALPVSASVEVSMVPKTTFNGYSTITSYTTSATSPSFYPFSVSAVGLDGSTLNFEAIKFNQNTQQFEYKEDVIYKTSTDTITFWEGTTIVEDFIVETTNNQIFYLTNPNVTKNSIQAYKVVELDDGTGTIREDALVYVDSFLSKEAQRDETDEQKQEIPYTFNTDNGKTYIEFAPISLIPKATKRPSLGDRIRVFYRIGGGKNTNIVKRAIDTVVPISADQGENATQLYLFNLKAASGGEDEETTDHAKEYAPLTVRAQERTVNEEDYVTVGKSYDKVYKIKTYGVKNLEASDVYNRYGEYIKPLEAWNYVLCKKNGYQDLVNDDVSKFRWLTQNFENRFNEIYAFRKGEFNHRILSPVLIAKGENNVNYFTLDLDIKTTDYFSAKISNDKTPSEIKKYDEVNNMFNDEILITSDPTDIDVEKIEKEFNPQITTINLYNFAVPDTSFEIALDGNKRIITMTYNADSNMLLDPEERTSYAEQLCAIINSNFLSSDYPVLPAQTNFVSNLNVILNNSSVGNAIGEALKFKMKIKYIDDGKYIYDEQEVKVPVDEINNFIENMARAIHTSFPSITANRILVENTTPEGSPNTTISISINNSFDVLDPEFENDKVVVFFEITEFPKDVEIYSNEVIGGGDYNNIAEVIYDENSERIRIKSPNTGNNANIILYASDQHPSAKVLFDIYDFKTDKYIYGLKTFEYNPDLKRFTFENGYFDLRYEYDENGNIINGDTFYLNYITSNDNEIEFGNYAAEAYSADQPGYREPAKRIYSTIYNDYDIDYVNSSFLVRFFYNKENMISIFQGMDSDLSLQTSSEITINNERLKISESPCAIIDIKKIALPGTYKIGIDVPGISAYSDPIKKKGTIEGINETLIVLDSSADGLSGTYHLTDNTTGYSYMVNINENIATITKELEPETVSEIEVGDSYSLSENKDEATFDADDKNTIIINAPSGDTSSSFATRLNAYLRDFYTTLKPIVFSKFTYAVAEDDIVKIYSPTKDAYSNVCIKEMDVAPGSEFSSLDKIAKTTGDYCITEKYKSVLYDDLDGFTIRYKDYNASDIIKAKDILLYGNRYYYVEYVNQDGNNCEIVIHHTDEEETINWDNATERLYFTDATLYLQKIGENFPDLDFYANYVADRRVVKNVFEYYEGDNDEIDLKNYMDKFKVVAVENVFKQPIINTFDVSGTVYYNSRLYTEDFVKKSVCDALRTNFNLDNMEFGESIKKSEVSSVIQNLTCVKWVNLKTIKRSYNNDSSKDLTRNEIPCYFDEILIISDDYVDDRSEKHGIMFDYMAEN